MISELLYNFLPDYSEVVEEAKPKITKKLETKKLQKSKKHKKSKKSHKKHSSQRYHDYKFGRKIRRLMASTLIRKLVEATFSNTIVQTPAVAVTVPVPAKKVNKIQNNENIQTTCFFLESEESGVPSPRKIPLKIRPRLPLKRKPKSATGVLTTCFNLDSVEFI